MPSSASAIHCPNDQCRKPIMTQVALVEGSRFVMKCPACGAFVRIIAAFQFIHKRILTDPKEKNILTEEAREGERL